ncbi:ChbG/HpnK family deacetylase [Exiguobacterium sp. SH0S2]|uniref:ChbG/HpnK family deacetylase n=1 Tax=Exiguobacterium sp. SH0S2 TaxID=2510950 RepID=UPI0010407216|nr:ChbG/HpnK family deacetylase [Exiguobacterium sp. SH0S2]TCI63096.1 ChbG/HpnK family deacetylase [Exiguobacterium sp. SH0S2]
MHKTHVLINADDFGLTSGVNTGILDSHVHGIVNSATMMMNGYAVEEAVTMAKLHPALHVGVHLALTWGRPLAKTSTPLTKEDGTFRYTNRFLTETAPDPELVYLEWKAQIEAFRATGLSLHHLDSHHHVHGWPAIQDVIVRLAEEYDTTFRALTTLDARRDLWVTERFSDQFYGDGVSRATLDAIQPGDSIEVMVHPADIDEILPSVTSYLVQRLLEKQLLINYERPDWWV